MIFVNKSNSFSDNNLDKIFVTKKDRVQLDTSSKGSQVRWCKENMFIKLDCLGYEGESEELVSILLDYSNVEHVRYRRCVVYENDICLGNGCYSFNFLQDGEKLVTFASLLKKYDRGYLSFTYDEVFEALFDATGLDVRPYMDQCICLDAIVKNEDRHFNNLALIDRGSEFRLAPIFDNGLACLSDVFSYPFEVDLISNLRNVYAKPFYTSFNRQVSLVHEPIQLDTKEFFKSVHGYGRSLDALKYGLDEWKGVAWCEKKEIKS